MSFASPHFELSEESLDEQTHLIAVQGEVHVSTAPEFSERLNDAIARGKTAVVIDMTEVAFIDSTGLSVLLNGLRLVNQRHGGLAIVCTNPTVLRLFQITNLDDTFDIFGDRREAIAHVVQRAGGGSSAGAP